MIPYDKAMKGDEALSSVREALELAGSEWTVATISNYDRKSEQALFDALSYLDLAADRIAEAKRVLVEQASLREAA